MAIHIFRVSRSNKLQLISLEEKASAARLDLDALSRFTELCLEVDEGAGMKVITTLSVSLNPYKANVLVPSQTVSLVPRYVVCNESPVPIIVRQCYLEVFTYSLIFPLSSYIPMYLILVAVSNNFPSA